MSDPAKQKPNYLSTTALVVLIAGLLIFSGSYLLKVNEAAFHLSKTPMPQPDKFSGCGLSKYVIGLDKGNKWKLEGHRILVVSDAVLADRECIAQIVAAARSMKENWAIEVRGFDRRIVLEMRFGAAIRRINDGISG